MKVFVFVICTFLHQIAVESAGIAEEKCKEYAKLAVSNPRARLNKRAVGGVPAGPGEFPHMAAIVFDDGKVNCGGSLISEQYILTTGVCARPKDKKIKAVRLGVHSISSSKDDVNVEEILIKEQIIHPDYKPPSRYHDIALLKLERPVNFTNFIRPACLQTETDLQTDSVIGTGWGVTESFGIEPSDVLLKVTMDIFTNEECNKEYSHSSQRHLKNGITDDLLCTGGRTESKDTCQGDSGGPVQILRKGHSNVYNIAGLISFGKSCGIVGVPAVNTRVSSYIPWIQSVVWA